MADAVKVIVSEEPVYVASKSEPVKVVPKQTPIIVNSQVQGVPGRDGMVIVNAATIYEFPAVGNSETLYCCTGENAVYRWVPELGHYLCVGRDYKEIKIINGGEIM